MKIESVSVHFRTQSWGWIWLGVLLGLAVWAGLSRDWWSLGFDLLGAAIVGLVLASGYREPSGGTIAEPTWEEGELAILNKGYEPIETPVEPVKRKHVAGMDLRKCPGCIDMNDGTT